MTFDDKLELLSEILQSRGASQTNIDLLRELGVLEEKRTEVEQDGDEYEMIFQILADRRYVDYLHLKQPELEIGEPWIRSKRPDFIMLKAPDQIAAVEISAFVDPVDLMGDENIFKIDFGEMVLVQGFAWHFKIDAYLGIFHPLDAKWDELNLGGWYDFEIGSAILDDYRDVESNRASPRYQREVMILHKAVCGHLEDLLQRFAN